jgi:glutaconate CoA-transferase subunit B
VERVTYISSPGYLDGGDARNRWVSSAAVPRRSSPPSASCGPTRRPASFSSTPISRFPGIEEILANTGWALKVAADVHVVPEPSPAELAALRRVDQTGMLRR